jgi:probable rRNA maturation factor
MNKIDVETKEVEPPSWVSNLPSFTTALLRALDIKNWELSVILCNDNTIQELNRRWRDIDSPTDVLTFSQIESADSDESGFIPPSPDGLIYAGDIIISLETLSRQAETFSVPEEEELKRLIIHGVLHLSGYNHPSNQPEEPMLTLQEQLLHTFSEVPLF